MKCYLVLFLLFIIINTQIDCTSVKRMEKKTESSSRTKLKQIICQKGLYFYAGRCVEFCPENTNADNYSLSCKPCNENGVYIKAYTIGRCINKCGTKFEDCSCEESCKKNGECCSDYKYCDYVNESLKANTSCQIKNCSACTSDSQTCLLCEEGYYFYKNQCVAQCPQGIKVNHRNRICTDAQICSIDNCEECDNFQCTRCSQGYYLHENECSSSCPEGTRANRINFACVNKSTFAFFMIFPSKNSCRNNKCGYRENNSDCSCHRHCLKDGNCCDDFEQECIDEIKKEKCKACNKCVEGKCTSCGPNSELLAGDCNCKPGYYYNIEFDKCLPLVGRFTRDKSNQNNQENLNKLLLDYFKQSPSTMDNNIYPSNNNMLFNGNVTMNIFSGNDNPSIINENIINENSFNNNTNIERNINSKNLIAGFHNDFNSKNLNEKSDALFNSIGVKKSNIKEKLINKEKTNDLKYNEESGDEDKNKKSEEVFKLNSHELDDSDHRSLNLDSNLESKESNRKLKMRKTKINIQKSFHLDNSKIFPEDIDHDIEEGTGDSEKSTKVQTQKKPKENILPKTTESKDNINKSDTLNQIKPSKPKSNPEKQSEYNNKQNFSAEQNKNSNININNKSSDINTSKIANNNSENINSVKKNNISQNISNIGDSHTINNNVQKVNNDKNIAQDNYNISNDDKIPYVTIDKPKKNIETNTDYNKKVQVNINIPGLDKADETHRHRVTVFNHYFINDKSMTMHHPKNPNVFNFFGNDCKDGKCISHNQDFQSFKNPEFISDNNFKTFNKTLSYENKGDNVVIDRHEGEHFLVPESKKNEVTEDVKSLTNLRIK